MTNTETDLFGHTAVVDFSSFDETMDYTSTITRADADEQKRDPAVFALTDALYLCDRKAAWSVYTNLLKQGYDVDADIVPKLWWALKTAFMVQSSTGSVHPFVAKKAQHLISSWGKQKMIDKSLDLFESVIESRTTGIDIQLVIEKWLISI